MEEKAFGQLFNRFLKREENKLRCCPQGGGVSRGAPGRVSVSHFNPPGRSANLSAGQEQSLINVALSKCLPIDIFCGTPRTVVSHVLRVWSDCI